MPTRPTKTLETRKTSQRKSKTSPAKQKAHTEGGYSRSGHESRVGSENEPKQSSRKMAMPDIFFKNARVQALFHQEAVNVSPMAEQCREGDPTSLSDAVELNDQESGVASFDRTHYPGPVGCQSARSKLSECMPGSISENEVCHSLHETSLPYQFFESAAVRAWYRGDSTNTVTVGTGADREDYSVGVDIVDAPNQAEDVSARTGVEAGFDLTSISDTRDERLAQIKIEAIKSMKGAADPVQACCVCELSNVQADIIRLKLTDDLVRRMKACLCVPRGVPDVVVGQYSASQFDSRLKGLLLLPSAIQMDGADLWCQICKSCHDCIVISKTPVLPIDAIANGNYIGHLPSRFKAMTRTDEQAVALVVPCVSVSVVTGGPCRTIKSHHYVVRNTEGPVAEMLPRNLSCRVRVTMVGCMTKPQVAACHKRYDLNLPLCRRVLHFLYLNNREYSQYRDQNHPQHRSQLTRELAPVVVDHTYEEGAPRDDEICVENVRDESTYSNFGSAVDERSNPANESTWIGTSRVLLSSPDQGCVDVIVRKSNSYVSNQNWASCVKMFPTLFPCGCGGPTEERQKRMSVRHWILRCLRIYGFRFEKHYAFMLLDFDYLAMENARRTLYIRMDVKRQALKAAEVKRSTILQAIKYFNYVSACRVKGIKPRPPVVEVQHVIDLRKGLRVPESAFYGSNIGRMRARHDLFGMLKRFGPLQVFFTISPDSAGTYSIAIKSGTVDAKAVQEADMLVMPNRAERKMIAALHPVECARYFLRVMDTVIERILGWDQKAHAPKRGGGIFGVVRAFGASAETQIAGDLHAHFAVWLFGFPTTSAELAQKFSSDESFYHRFVGLVDAVLITKPPCLSNENVCPRCGAEGSLTPVIPGIDAFRRPAPGTTPETTARCLECGVELKDKDIIEASIQALADAEGKKTNTQLADFEKCRSPQFDLTNDLATSLLVRDLQVHYWNHCKSCFKKTVRTPRGSICRFIKPESANPGPTTIVGGEKVVLHRPIGCEYVNGYNPVIMAAMKCNHDAQFVLSSGARDTAAYVIKYCFKKQNPIENQAALSLAAFTKAVNKSDALPAETGAIERGYKILGSMLYTVTNGQEVAAPMAALYILNESPFWFSHAFTHINLHNLLQRTIHTV